MSDNTAPTDTAQEETEKEDYSELEQDLMVMLLGTVRTNRALIKQARAEIQQYREELNKRRAWRDFLNKYFKLSL